MLGRVSERNSIGTLIDGSDSDLNWLFSAPITGWGIRGNRAPAGSAAPSRPKSHLIRKSDESRDKRWGFEWIGAFLWLTLASRRVTSNQIFQVRTTTTRRPWQIAIRWPLHVPASVPKRRRFRVKNCLPRFENLTCTTTDRCNRHHPVA